MSDAVLRSTEGRIGILTINNPPVNALAAAVRDGIKQGIEAFGADSSIDAIVVDLPVPVPPTSSSKPRSCIISVLRISGNPSA